MNKEKGGFQTRSKTRTKTRSKLGLKKNNITKKKLNCAPSPEFKFTCLTKNILFKLKNSWNSLDNSNKILSNNPYTIWKFFDKVLKNKCNNEKCWLEQIFVKNNISISEINNLYRPKSPGSWKSNPNEWLSSNDIIKVMKQYEKKFTYFKFLGPSPIDFDKKLKYGQCVWNTLCNFSLEKYIKNGKTKIGIIFNTDPHYLSGSHWVCLFIDINKNFIYYFDSTGDSIPRLIKKLVDKIQNQGKDLGLDLEYKINKFKHQYGDTECGMYVLVIIILLLKNKITLKQLNKRITDKEMTKLRKVLFNP